VGGHRGQGRGCGGVRGVHDMGLRVAANKTEAIYFYDKASWAPSEIRIRVAGTSILVGDRLKYLGLLLDGRWSFGHHFGVLVLRVERVSAALGRLLPNLGGPDARIRRIYMGVVNSVALYGAPIWAKDLAARRNAKDMFRRIHGREGHKSIPDCLPCGGYNYSGLATTGVSRSNVRRHILA